MTLTPPRFHEGLTELSPHLSASPGLQALEAVDRRRITVRNTRALVGSCNLDRDLRPTQPQAARFDYAIGLEQGVHFVEVHPATSDPNVKEVGRKVRWLHDLLRPTSLPVVGVHWVASGKVSSVPAFARKRRAMAQLGIPKPRSHLTL